MIGCKKEKVKDIEAQKEPFEGYFFIRMKINSTTDAYLHAMNLVPPQDTVGLDINLNNDIASTENLWRFSAPEKGMYIISPYSDSLKVLSFVDPYLRLVPRNAGTDNKILFSIDSLTDNLVTFRSIEYDKYMAFQYCEMGWSSYAFSLYSKNNCPLLTITADTCFCTQTFELVRK